MPAPANIFEAFNARALEPSEVAATFVPPGHYGRLARRSHTLLVGPRGSGKTTLLKMLQGPALEAWSHPEADHFREVVDFTGVFVPADRSWSAQIDTAGEALNDDHRRLIGVATFSAHVLRSLIMAIEYRVHSPEGPLLHAHRRAPIRRAEESRFVKDVAAAWHLAVRVPSLMGIRHALTLRLAGIQELHSRERTLGAEGREERLAGTPFLHINFLAAVSLAVELFDALDRQRGKWALLFDELELAPQWIRESLMASLRSSDDRLLFKLSLSPFSEGVRRLQEALAPSAGQDYEPIALWYPHKEDGYRFCDALLRSILHGRGLGSVSPQQLLGRSEFETFPAESRRLGTAYGPHSRLQRRFASLAAKDASFRRYLAAHGIDARRLQDIRGEQRAADIRKITGLVAVRDAFRAPDSEEVARGKGLRVRRERSRKNPQLYRGATSLFAMVEGNPRWLIGIASGLLEGYSKGEEPIPAARQASEVAKAANRFRAFLKTIPCPAMNGRGTLRGALSVLDAVGDFFFERVVMQEFNPEPAASFIVDSQTDPQLLRSLAEALNAGAIVYVPDGSEPVVLDSLRGKRFRIVYLLAPHYGIPLHLARAISLGTILSERRGERPGQVGPLFARRKPGDVSGY